MSPVASEVFKYTDIRLVGNMVVTCLLLPAAAAAMFHAAAHALQHERGEELHSRRRREVSSSLANVSVVA
jgi:hypothetical protein